MAKILHIDTDLQIPNRIHKSATDNKVRQITDKAQGIAFVQTDVAKQPVYNYGGWYDFTSDKLTANKPLNRLDKFTLRWVQSKTMANFWLLSAQVDWYFVHDSGRFLVKNSLAQFTLGGFAQIDGNSLYEICYDGSNLVLIINGVVLDKQSKTMYLQSTIPPTICGYELNDTANLTGALKFFELYDSSLYSLSSLSVGNVVHTNNGNATAFTHYQRYPEDGFKKLFISSKYLKDAVIDSADNITTLYSTYVIDSVALNVVYPNSKMIARSGANKLKLDKGLKITPTTLKYIDITDLNDPLKKIYSTVISPTFIGVWFNPVTANGNQFWFRYLLQNSTNSVTLLDFYFVFNYSTETNKALFYDASAPTFDYSTTQGLNTWCYLSLFIKDGVLYYFLNGVFIGSRAKAIATTTYMHSIHIGNDVGNALDTIKFDDVLLSIGDSIIDPTGYVVGEKVFEPPTRGGFDGTFKQY